MQRCLKIFVATHPTEQQIEKQCERKTNYTDEICSLHSEHFVPKLSISKVAMINYRHNTYLRSASRSIFAAVSKESGELHIDAIANFAKPFWTAEQIDRADNMRGDQNGEKINKSHAEPFQHVKRWGLKMTNEVSNRPCCIAAMLWVHTWAVLSCRSENQRCPSKYRRYVTALDSPHKSGNFSIRLVV